MKISKICCPGAGCVGGPTMAMIADKMTGQLMFKSREGLTTTPSMVLPSMP